MSVIAAASTPVQVAFDWQDRPMTVADLEDRAGETKGVWDAVDTSPDLEAQNTIRYDRFENRLKLYDCREIETSKWLFDITGGRYERK